MQKKPRADAIRNRERLLEIARESFAEMGDAVTFDEIASRSGLGVGTLYRHFPNREALAEAVYLAEHQRLVEAAKEFEATLSPVEALRAWLRMFVELLATKRAMKESLNAFFDQKPDVYSAVRNLAGETISRLVKSAEEAREIKPGIDPTDLLRALVGISTASTGPEWRDSALKMVDLLVAGMVAEAR
ncbi:TetR/AcrR family transcriptional regulator [Fimbriimonas ginsengisoli]|uniref:TetR family transcriptional regulator n=1 Tax=Fimbriimonas ginsengisoli Gsoil 348 TaxID=661478 RepID=A0A068NSM3_FIMGI|nr:TetR/AcrR family transcriptional regulator [Fimbriimonas ginsengisoli]AIE84589.1 TetR family transcriptional regulator [Fimbriimonas ginsengisoli Gsoil 348]